MWIVIQKLHIFVAELVEGVDVRVQNNCGQWAWVTRQLETGLFEVVGVKVEVTKGVDEFARFQAGYMGDHHCQERIRGDVERHAKKQVGAPLVQLAAQPVVLDEKLEHGMARWQRHLLEIANVPCAHDEAAAERVSADFINNALELVNGVAIAAFPCAPLCAIDWAEAAVWSRPFVPDCNAVLLEPADVGVAADEPKQFVQDRLKMDLLGSDQRETSLEIVPCLSAKNCDCSRACPVATGFAALEH